MEETQVPVEPKELVRRFRQNYVNAHELRRRVPGALPKADLKTRNEKPLRENDLPPGLRALLDDYRKRTPGTRVTLLKYQRLENGEPTTIVEDAAGLPEEDALLTLSETVTLTTSSEVRVVTEIVVATIERA